MIIKTGFGENQETYFATERISDMGPAYRLTKAGTMQFYDVLPADLENGYSECSCASHIYRGACKHVAALRSMLGIGKDGRYPARKKPFTTTSKVVRPNTAVTTVITAPTRIISPITRESVTRAIERDALSSYSSRKPRSEKQIAASQRWAARMNGDSDKVHGQDDGEWPTPRGESFTY